MKFQVCMGAGAGRLLSTLALATATCFVAAPAMAQTADEPVQQIDLSVDIRHDDNVAHANQERAEARGLKLSDERATLGAHVQFARPLGRNSIQLDAFAGYDFYRRNTQLNRERLSLTGDVALNAGPCTAYFQPKFRRGQSDLSDLAAVDIDGELSVRNVETIQVYHGEVRCGRMNGIRPFVSYERSWGDNSNLIRKISDYHGERIGAGIGYSNPILGYVDVSYERENLNYPNRLPTDDNLVGYRQEDIRVAFGRSIGRALKLDGFVAHTRLRPKSSSAPPFTGLSWNALVTLTPSDRISVQASYGKSISPSLGVEALYTRNRDLLFDGTYYFSDRTSFSLRASRARRTYSGATSELGPLLANYRLDQLSGRVSFAPNQRLRFILEGGYEHRTSNAEFYNYSSAFFGLNTTFTFGRP